MMWYLNSLNMQVPRCWCAWTQLLGGHRQVSHARLPLRQGAVE